MDLPAAPPPAIPENAPDILGRSFCFLAAGLLFLITGLLLVLQTRYYPESQPENVRLLNVLVGAQGLCVFYALLLAGAGLLRQRARAALPILLLTPLLSLIFPYDFRLTESQILMKILQYQDFDLFTTDLAMQSTQVIGGYNFFARLFAIFPYSVIPQVFYLVWLLCLGFIGLFFQMSYRRFFQSRHALPLACLSLIILGLTYHWQKYGGFILGDNDLTYNWFRHQSLAWPLCLWALYFYFRQRWMMFGLLTGLVINIHINSGQQWLLLIFVDALLFNRRQWRGVLVGLTMAALISSVTLAPVILHEVLHPSPHRVSHGFTLVSGYLRHPHHIIPSSWPRLYYLQYGIFLALGGACWWAWRPRTALDRRLLTMVLVCLGALVCGYIFVEIFPVDLVAETQMARMTIFTKVIFLMYIVATLGRGLEWVAQRGPFAELSPITLWTGRVGRSVLVAGGLPVLLCAGLALTVLRHYVIVPPQTPLERFFSRQTPKAATLLIPPTYEFIHFGERARRGVLANLNIFPFASPWYLDYYERLMASQALPARYDRDFIRGLHYKDFSVRYHRLTDADLLALNRRYPFDYLIRKQGAPPLTRFDKVFEDGAWVVYHQTGSARAKMPPPRGL